MFTALVAGQIVFAVITSVVVFSGNFSPRSSLGNYVTHIIILCLALGLSGFFLGSTFFRRKLEQLNSSSKPLAEKFNDYRGANIGRWALSEFATLLSLVMVFVTGSPLLLVVAIFLIALFLTTRPSVSKAASDLNVSEVEIGQLDSRAINL